MTSTIFEFGNLVSDRNEFDEWLRVVGLLPRNKKCPECGGQMKKEKSQDLFVCHKKHFGQRKKIKISALKGTVFEGTKLSKRNWDASTILL